MHPRTVVRPAQLKKSQWTCLPFAFATTKTVQTAYQFCFWNGDVVVNLHVW
jgi:hypothetical protein